MKQKQIYLITLKRLKKVTDKLNKDVQNTKGNSMVDVEDVINVYRDELRKSM